VLSAGFRAKRPSGLPRGPSRTKSELHAERNYTLSLNLPTKQECALSELSNPSSMLFLSDFSSIFSKVIEIFFF